MALFPLRTWVPDFSEAQPYSMRQAVEPVYGDVYYLSFSLPNGQVAELPFHSYRVDEDGKENPHGDYVELRETTYKHHKHGYTNGEKISVITSLWGSPRGCKVEDEAVDDDGDRVWAVRFAIEAFAPKEEEPAEFVVMTYSKHDLSNGEDGPTSIYHTRANTEREAMSKVWIQISGTTMDDYFGWDAFRTEFKGTQPRNTIHRTRKIIEMK